MKLAQDLFAKKLVGNVKSNSTNYLLIIKFNYFVTIKISQGFTNFYTISLRYLFCLKFNELIRFYIIHFNFIFLNDTYVSIFYLFFLSNQSSLEVWQASNQFQGSNRTQLKPIHSNAGTLHKIKMPLVEKRERKRYKKENIRRSLNVIRTYDR